MIEAPPAAATVADLRQALAEDALELHYQPIVDVSTGRTVQVEALVRWSHPTLGMLNAGQFVPMAEQEGLAVDLGRWVLRTACADIARRRRRGLFPLGAGTDLPSLAVNVSAYQLDAPDFADLVVEVLDRTGLEPERLCLEITESAILDQSVATRSALARARSHGVRIAVDDFGTGYATLASLRQIPATSVKIDRLFSRVEASPVDRAIVATVLGLAERLGLSVVAEGVEDGAQASALAAMGCELQQGYHHGRPAPLPKPLLPTRRPVRNARRAGSSALAPAPSADDEARVQSLRWYTSGVSAAADLLDGVVALAAAACHRPVALLSMVDRHDQWVLARSGMDGLAGVSRSDAICAHTILGDGIFEVEDLLADRRFADSPLACGWPRIRSYAGAPIVTADHHAIGVLCVIDGEPGRLGEGERHLLRDLAAHTMAVLELLHGRRP